MTFFRKTQQSLSHNDVLERSKLFEAEFNKPDLHDRVLIFDVVVPRGFSSAIVDENEIQKKETTTESEDGNKDDVKNQETGMDINDESTPGSTPK